MITEFTCGIYSVCLNSNIDRWLLMTNGYQLATIYTDGSAIVFNNKMSLIVSHADLSDISELMNNIKRQYKQLQTT